jgi:hypothetical protein
MLIVDPSSLNMLSFVSLRSMQKWDRYGNLKFDTWNLIHSFCMIYVELGQNIDWLVMCVKRSTRWCDYFQFLWTFVLGLWRTRRTVWRLLKFFQN